LLTFSSRFAVTSAVGCAIGLEVAVGVGVTFRVDFGALTCECQNADARITIMAAPKMG
jgi:hypothetical protein